MAVRGTVTVPVVVEVEPGRIPSSRAGGVEPLDIVRALLAGRTQA